MLVEQIRRSHVWREAGTSRYRRRLLFMLRLRGSVHHQIGLLSRYRCGWNVVSEQVAKEFTTQLEVYESHPLDAFFRPALSPITSQPRNRQLSTCRRQSEGKCVKPC